MNLKKWAAIVLCLALTFSLTGCIGNLYENVGTINGTEISSGLYQMAQYSAFSEAKQKVEDPDKDVLKQKIDGKSSSAWIQNRTEELLREYVAVRTLAREKDIVLDATGEENLGQISQYWSYLEESYAKNGISAVSFERYNTTQELRRQVFDATFAEGGALYIPDEELRAQYQENFVHIRAISIPLNALDETLDVQAEVKEKAKEILDNLNSGKTLEQVVEKDLPAVYEILQRDFDPATSADTIFDTYINLHPESFEVYSEEFLSRLAGQKVGDFGTYTLENTVIIYEVVPAFADDEDFAAQRSKVLNELKKDAFNEYLASIYNAYTVNWRLGARTYFRPSRMVL